MSRRLWITVRLIGLGVAGCANAGEQSEVALALGALAQDGYATPEDAKASLGERLFEDPGLSASGTQSCASCHREDQAFTGNNHDDPSFPVAIGAFPSLFGSRNTPTAMYTSFIPAFGFVPAQRGGQTTFIPQGGVFWDGRADSLEQQAGGPFLNPREMAQPSKQAVIDAVAVAEYAPLFESVFGAGALADTERAYDQLTEAIAAYERTPSFSPFSSKFDAMLRGMAQFSDQEQRGFELFSDREKGNCLLCHTGTPGSSEPHDWLFSDLGYHTLAVPRNCDIPDNADAEHHDLGLCARADIGERLPPEVSDPEAFRTQLCGAFKTPSLRNISQSAPYMHNGFFKDLRQVVEFYATRETNPSAWYPSESGVLLKYDDLPGPHKANVVSVFAPFDRAEGQEPRLSPDEIDAIVAFLYTLRDGYEL